MPLAFNHFIRIRITRRFCFSVAENALKTFPHWNITHRFQITIKKIRSWLCLKTNNFFFRSQKQFFSFFPEMFCLQNLLLLNVKKKAFKNAYKFFFDAAQMKASQTIIKYWLMLFDFCRRFRRKPFGLISAPRFSGG